MLIEIKNLSGRFGRENYIENFKRLWITWDNFNKKGGQLRLCCKHDISILNR